MPLPGDDDQLIEYLLGRLPEKEAERLDELSITDDAFASRLSATENDLVDAYIRGELSGETLERFRSFYLASPLRQEKVHFAEALLAHERVMKPSLAAESARTRDRAEQAAHDGFARGSRRGFFQLVPQWSFATAALLLLIAASLLLLQNRRLNTQIAQVEAERARLAHNQQELEKQLQEQRPAGAGTVAAAQQSTAGRTSNTKEGVAPVARIASFVLSPALRGAESIGTIAAPPEAKQIRVKLLLEANNFSRYRVTLKDPATDHARWRSGEISAEAAGKAVSVLLSTRLLKQQNYTFELSGITDRATSEFIGSYPFRFMVK